MMWPKYTPDIRTPPLIVDVRPRAVFAIYEGTDLKPVPDCIVCPTPAVGADLHRTDAVRGVTTLALTS